MRLLRPTSLRIRSTLRSPLSSDRKRKDSQKDAGQALRHRDTTDSAASSVSAPQDTSARTLQHILSFRPPKSRARSEISTETVSGDETNEQPSDQLHIERKKWKLSTAQLERKVDVLQDEVGRLRDEIAEQRAEVDRVKSERNELRRRVRLVEDEEGSGSKVQGLRREMERIRWCAAWYKLRSVKLQRAIASESGYTKGQSAQGDEDGENWVDVVGEPVMAAIEQQGAGVGVDGWDDDDSDGGMTMARLKDQEIDRLEHLLRDEFGMRVELEGMVEEMTEVLHRRDEEERRASEYLEGRWRRAEEDLKNLMQSVDGKRPGWTDDTRRVTTAVDSGDHFWM